MVSYVIPVFNEEESVQAFYSEMEKVVSKLTEDYEIIFIDDGSTDSSLPLLKELHKKDKHVKVFSFRKNHGKAEALMLGFQKAKGEYIVTLDADLQDKPTEIHKLLTKINGEWDVVCGWRKDRKDKKKMVLASRIFNWIAKTFWGLELHDYNCGLKAYTADAAKSLRLYGGFHRFIPLLAYQQGFSITEIAVEHQERKYGSSKYGFSKVWKDLPDIFTMIFLNKYSTRPLHFFGVVGTILFIIGLISLIYLSILHFYGQPIWRRPLLTISTLMMLAGLQISLTGFLAELIINTSSREIVHYPLRFSSDKE